MFPTVREFYLHFLCFLQSLIPLKDEWDMKSDEKKSSEVYKQSCDEHNEIMEVCNFFLCFNTYL